ncbi:MAG: hypothetical protein WCI95_11010 [bacterium]
MGLYDRDYMRETPQGESDEASGVNRLQSRRRRVIVIGMVLLVAAMLAILATK